MNPAQRSTIQRKWPVKMATHAVIQQAAGSLEAGAHTKASHAKTNRRFELYRNAMERYDKGLQQVQRAICAAGIRIRPCDGT